jgi:hypothetical protein
VDGTEDDDEKMEAPSSDGDGLRTEGGGDGSTGTSAAKAEKVVAAGGSLWPPGNATEERGDVAGVVRGV